MEETNSNLIFKVSLWLSYVALLFDLIAAIAVFTGARSAGTGLLDSYLNIFFTFIGWLAPLVSLVLGAVAKNKNAIIFSVVSLLFFGAAYLMLPSMILP